MTVLKIKQSKHIGSKQTYRNPIELVWTNKRNETLTKKKTKAKNENKNKNKISNREETREVRKKNINNNKRCLKTLIGTS